MRPLLGMGAVAILLVVCHSALNSPILANLFSMLTVPEKLSKEAAPLQQQYKLDNRTWDAGQASTQSDEATDANRKKALVALSALPEWFGEGAQTGRKNNTLRIALFKRDNYYSQTTVDAWVEGSKSCFQEAGCAIVRESEAPDAVVIMGGAPTRGMNSLQTLKALPLHQRPKAFGLLISEKDHFFENGKSKLPRSAWDFTVSYRRTGLVNIGKNCAHLQRALDNSPDLSKTFERPKGIAGFVSNCGAKERFKYIGDLMKHVPVDQYGKCHHNTNLPVSRSEQGWMQKKEQLLGQYKFLLAFENEEAEDYVSEKIFNAFVAGAIPIYSGTADVSRIVPPGSYIDTRHFKTPSDLAAHLLALQTNRSLFEGYLRWSRSDIESLMARADCKRGWPCRLCHALRAHPLPLKTPSEPPRQPGAGSWRRGTGRRDSGSTRTH